jgi:hypothetical protein
METVLAVVMAVGVLALIGTLIVGVVTLGGVVLGTRIGPEGDSDYD